MTEATKPKTTKRLTDAARIKALTERVVAAEGKVTSLENRLEETQAELAVRVDELDKIVARLGRGKSWWKDR